MASFGGGGQDEPNQEKEHRKNAVLNEMVDLFLEHFEIEVIQTVIESLDYDYEKSKKALESMREENLQNETPKSPSPQPPPQPRHPEHQRVQHANHKPLAAQLTGSPLIKTQQNTNRIAQSPNRNPVDPTLERIHEYIKNGDKILILLRGCPGSGKSFLAAQLLQSCGGERSNHVFSSDDYFVRNGRYFFNAQELQQAHKSNQDNVLRAVRNGYSPVIVDNTNTQSWEMQVYVIMAVNHGYAVETLEPPTPWKFNYSQLLRKNTHNVPADRIRAMLERYEHGLRGEDIIKQLKLSYPPSKYPPQPARRTSNRRPEPAAKSLASFFPQMRNRQPQSLQPEPKNSPAQETTLSKTPEQRPSTSRAQLPFSLSFGNPGPVSSSNPFQISLSDVANVFQSILSPSNPKPSDPPPESSDTVASNVNTQEDTGNLINLESTSDVAGALVPKEPEKCKEEPVNLEWGNIDWEVVENKQDSNCSTDQRRRWVFADKKDEETIHTDTPRSVAQNIGVDWCEHDSSPWETLLETDKTEDFSQRKQFLSPTKQDNSSNTHFQDFQLISENKPLPEGMRLLEGSSRDINANLVNYVAPIPRKIVVDVSSMTDSESGSPVEGSIKELLRLFPHVNIGNLETLLETCQGDVNWASNCLLDTESGVRLDTALIPRSRTPSPEIPLPEIPSSEIPLPEVPAVEEDRQPEPAESNSCEVALPEQPPSPLNRGIFQDSVRVQLDEEVFVRPCSSVPLVSDLLPVTPVDINPLRKVPELRPLTPKKKVLYPGSSDDEVPETSDESEASSQDEDEMLEFVISPEFSQQLFSRFGGPLNKVRKSGLSPVLRIPDSLAHQIHYYLVMSQEYYAEDNGGIGEEEEDEELSGPDSQDKIDQQLFNEMCAQKPLTEQEQEDMELATAIYEMDLAAMYNPKETMASVLTRKLLQDSFPTLDPNLLDELMEVHGNSFHKTKEMIQEHYMNSYTVKQKDFPALNQSQPKTPSRSRPDVSDRVKMRAEADEELQIARIYNQKAQEKGAKREWSAAAVYSQMAKIHKRKHNRNMEQTVQRVYADNMRSYCPSSLDLHYLVVDQALNELDDFLDEHILSLADQPHRAKSLYIITGRGKHSSGGIPKIRPAVLQRLDEREIESKLENPGLVRVEVTGRSLLSSDC